MGEFVKYQIMYGPGKALPMQAGLAASGEGVRKG